MKLFRIRHPFPWLAIAFSIIAIVSLLVDAYVNSQPPLHLVRFLILPVIAIMISSATLIRSQRPHLATVLTYLGVALGVISIGLIFAT